MAINYSQLFSNAHKIAKAERANYPTYRGAFSMALRTLYAELREPKVDANKDIVKVFVFWSEGHTFNTVLGCDKNIDINKEISIEEYEKLAMAQAIECGSEGGYDKTKVKVILRDGREYQFRHDINMNHASLKADWSAWVDYCNK